MKTFIFNLLVLVGRLFMVFLVLIAIAAALPLFLIASIAELIDNTIRLKRERTEYID